MSPSQHWTLDWHSEKMSRPPKLPALGSFSTYHLWLPAWWCQVCWWFIIIHDRPLEPAVLSVSGCLRDGLSHSYVRRRAARYSGLLEPGDGLDWIEKLLSTCISREISANVLSSFGLSKYVPTVGEWWSAMCQSLLIDQWHITSQATDSRWRHSCALSVLVRSPKQRLWLTIDG